LLTEPSAGSAEGAAPPASATTPTASPGAGEQEGGDHGSPAEGARTDFAAGQTKVSIGDMADDEGRNRSRDGGVEQEGLTRQRTHLPNIAAPTALRKSGNRVLEAPGRRTPYSSSIT